MYNVYREGGVGGGHKRNTCRRESGLGEARVLISLRKVVAWIIKTRWKHASFFRLICIRSGQGDVGEDLGATPPLCVSALYSWIQKHRALLLFICRKSVRKIALQWRAEDVKVFEKFLFENFESRDNCLKGIRRSYRCVPCYSVLNSG